MSKTEMSRVNHHMPKRMHIDVKELATKSEVSATILINRAVEHYLNFIGSGVSVPIYVPDSAEEETAVVPPTQDQQVIIDMCKEIIGTKHQWESTLISCIDMEASVFTDKEFTQSTLRQFSVSGVNQVFTFDGEIYKRAAQ